MNFDDLVDIVFSIAGENFLEEDPDVPGSYLLDLPTVTIGGVAISVDINETDETLVTATAPKVSFPAGSYPLVVTRFGEDSVKRTDNLDITIGAVGPQGPAGADGADGEPGPAGPFSVSKVGWVWADQASAPLNTPYSPSAPFQYNSASPGTAVNSVTREAVGLYRVLFPGLTNSPSSPAGGGTVQVTTYQGNRNLKNCEVRTWGNMVSPANTGFVLVECFDLTGGAFNYVDQRFNVMYMIP